MFTNVDNSLTADGLSFEELFQKGARNLNAAFNNDGMFAKATASETDSLEDTNEVTFAFYTDDKYMFILYEDGRAVTSDATGTYTYSNGHYVFTMDGEAPK